MISSTDIAWAAGFLEGEGSFVGGKQSQVTVSAVQVEIAPLERLVGMCGGYLKQYRYKPGRAASPFWRWTVNGQRAAEVAFTVYTWMSPKRRRQIERMVLVWRNAPGSHNARKTHCPKGHPYDAVNTRPIRGGRQCRACTESQRRDRWRRDRAYVAPGQLRLVQ
jgi:hypothetical protein